MKDESKLMTLEEMDKRGYTCAGHPWNTRDNIVVEEIWIAAIEICKRLDKLIESNTKE